MAGNGDLGAVVRRNTDQLAAVDALAGALVNAVRHSFEQAIVPGPSQSPRPEHMLPGGSSSTPQRKVTEYQRAANQGTKKNKLSVAPPSLFSQSSSSRRSNSRKRKQSDVQAKSTTYVRDIVLLPEEFRSENGSICIPRSTRREKLGKAGLVGKIEITSSMTEDEVRSEICEVFAVPMGLTVEDIKNGTRFQFSYLLRSGCNSRTLRVPTVKDTLQWNRKQVTSLAKSGSFIYLLESHCQLG